MTKRRSSHVRVASLGAVATALAVAPLSAQGDDVAKNSEPTLRATTSSTNDVGCVKTTFERIPKAGESREAAYLFSRPHHLNVEILTDDELRSCGLPTRRAFHVVSKNSPRYVDWLLQVRASLTAKQIIPWEAPPPSPGYIPPPPPAMPGGSPPWRHSRLDRNSVRPGSADDGDGYADMPGPNFAGREILDNAFIDNDQPGAPEIVTSVIPSAKYILPTPTQAVVQTQISSWIGYADVVDSASGGTSLAQIGIIDYVFNTVSGGANIRDIAPFVEFYPDTPSVLLAMRINPSDTVSLTLDYAGPSSFGHTITDSRANGETVANGSVALSNTSACAHGVTAFGTLITICNNGDLAEWFVEDHGQYSTQIPDQDPPSTPAFKNIDLVNPSVTWINGDYTIPNNNPCMVCNFESDEQEINDSSTGSTLTIKPSWLDSNTLRFHYNGPSAPGFDWPS